MARRGVWVAAACAAVMVMLGLSLHEAGAAPAPAATSTDGQSRPAVMGTLPTDSGLSVSIDSLSPRIITSESEVVISGTIRNDSPTTLASVALEVFVANETPISVSALTTQLSDDEPDATHAASTTLTDVARGTTTPFEIRIPTSSLPLSDSDEWGPRVTTVAASSGSFSGKDRTILVWDSGAQVAASRVSTVVPWTSANAANNQAERSAILTLAGTSGVTLAVDPLLIPRGPQPTAVPSPTPSPTADEAQSGAQSDQGEQSGAASPSPTPSPVPTPAPTATDPARRSQELQSEAFVASFMSTASEVIALPDGDADLGALALSGNSGFWNLASGSIASFPSTLRASGWVAPTPGGATPSPSPSGHPSASASPSPTTTPSPAATAVGQSATQTATPDSGPTILRNVAWPADTTFGTSFLAGFASADQITIAPTSALTPAEDVPFTSYARVNVNPATGETTTDGTGAHTLAQQGDIASILSWNASGGDQLDAEQALTAITAIIARERPSSSRTLFAAADRTTTINERLSHRLAALYSPRWVSATSFSDIAASESTDLERTTVAPGTLPDDTWTAIDSMASSLTNLTPLANATDDPNAVFDSVTPAILPALSVSSTPSEQLDAATAMTSQVTTMLSSVTVEPSSAVNLINKSAKFPVLIRNNLDWPVRVDVTLIPDDPRLRATPALSQELAARGATTVEVPVGAIGSGDIEVTYKVTTSDGYVLDDSRTVTVRMRAGWEDAITAVIASLFGLLFLVGITRSLRSRAARKKQASDANEASASQTDASQTDATDEAPRPDEASDAPHDTTDHETDTTKETP